MLTMMRFDDSYSNLVKEEPAQGGQVSKLKMITGGGTYQFSKFPICFANLERFVSLLKMAKKQASR